MTFLMKAFYIFFFTFFLFFNFSNKLISNENKFEIKGIEISEEFNLNFTKKTVIEKAFKKGFFDILHQCLQSNDFIKIKNTKLKEIKPLIENFKVKEEKFKDNKYFAKFDINFNKNKIYDFLKNKDLFFSFPVRTNIVFFPIIIDNNNNKLFAENIFYKNWQNEINNNHLINYILPIEDIEDLNNFTLNKENIEQLDMSNISNKYNSQNYILAIIYKNNDKLNIYSKIKLNKKIINSNFLIDYFDMKDNKLINIYISQLKTHYEDLWKKNNQINTSIKLSLQIFFPNSDFKKIKDFEHKLNQIELINSFSIKEFDLKENIYEIIYNGSPDILMTKFLEYNIPLVYENEKWIYYER